MREDLRERARRLERPVLATARLVARARLPRLVRGGVTIVTVNWNSLPYLEVLLTAVRRFSPPDVRILVVDNASTDGSRAVVRRSPGVRLLPLPLNVGHGAGLDLGFLMASTEFVVALDVDAFPVSPSWLEVLLDPLRAGAAVSGAHLTRRYVHPCCLAIRLERFVRKSHSFRPHEAEDGGWDVGESISLREAGHQHLLEATSKRGPGNVGTIFGDVVYHNFYATRFGRTDRRRLDNVVTRDDPTVAWQEATTRYLGISGG